MEFANRTFETYGAYLDFLQAKTCHPNPRYLADHERQHLDAAISLGYSAVYGVRYLANDFPHLVVAGFIDFPDGEPTKKDLIDILLAPDEPGDEDLLLVEKLKSELKC